MQGKNTVVASRYQQLSQRAYAYMPTRRRIPAWGQAEVFKAKGVRLKALGIRLYASSVKLLCG